MHFIYFLQSFLAIIYNYLQSFWNNSMKHNLLRPHFILVLWVSNLCFKELFQNFCNQLKLFFDKNESWKCKSLLIKNLFEHFLEINVKHLWVTTVKHFWVTTEEHFSVTTVKHYWVTTVKHFWVTTVKHFWVTTVKYLWVTTVKHFE